MNKKRAMSYAEMLIVLAVLGVIAALTLPSLKKHSQREEYGRLAQKAYSTIDLAIDSSIHDNGDPTTWDYTAANQSSFLSTYISPYIKKKADDNTLSSDGMSFTMGSCDGNACVINVDVNGANEPNYAGRDQFTFSIDKERGNVQPTGTAASLRDANWRFTDEIWNATASE